jgi:hypothetical protein
MRRRSCGWIGRRPGRGGSEIGRQSAEGRRPVLHFAEQPSGQATRLDHELSASVDVNVQANRIVNYTFRRRNSDDDKRDAEAPKAEQVRE